jgi:presqualene diphosphate synthase
MFDIYGFCRAVDDIADDLEGERPARHAALQKWRGEIDAIYAGRPAPGLTGLARSIAVYDLQRRDFLAVIDGMEMDVAADIRAPDRATLDLYCDRVACAVGRLSTRIFGLEARAGEALADHLGRALQLTNILRDLREDAERGRLYLPREYLTDAGVPFDPDAALTHPALPLVCARVADLAHENFRAAASAMRKCNRRAMRPARLMGATYSAILDRLERRGWQRLDVPAKLPKWQKALIAARHLLP